MGSRLYGVTWTCLLFSSHEPQAALPDADVDLVLEWRAPPEAFDAARRSAQGALLQLRRRLEMAPEWHVEEMALDAKRPTLRLRRAFRKTLRCRDLAVFKGDWP